MNKPNTPAQGPHSGLAERMREIAEKLATEQEELTDADKAVIRKLLWELYEPS